MSLEDKPKPRLVIYGEGAVHPPFQGSVYIKDDRETQEQAEWRVNESMKTLGFEWLPNRRA